MRSVLSPSAVLVLMLALGGAPWMLPRATAEGGKRLVLFAGPHRAGATSVEEFFHKYCYGWVKRDQVSFAMRYWKWPNTTGLPNDDGRVPAYKLFQHLVLNGEGGEDGLTQDLMGAIVTAWETTTAGIILGTEFFDQMGPYAEHDGLAAMKRVVAAVGAAPEDVTVVVNYRTPRFDHWESVWRDSVQGTSRTYQEFLCTRSGYHEKMELLDTAMNPLQIAKVSRQQGWKVALMDMMAIEGAGMDVSHAIACKVMGAKCDEAGWVNNHPNEAIHNNPAEDGHDITELTGSDRWLAERLFQARDCAYRPALENDSSFTVIPQGGNSIWTDAYCDPAKDGTIYQELFNVETVFRGLLSQMKCADKPYDDMPNSINDILDGKYTLTRPPPAEDVPVSSPVGIEDNGDGGISGETTSGESVSGESVSGESGGGEGVSGESSGGVGSVAAESSTSSEGSSASSGGGGGGNKFLWFLLLLVGVAFYVREDMNSPNGGRVVPTVNRWIRAMRQTTAQHHHPYQQPAARGAGVFRSPEAEMEPIGMSSTKLSDVI
jgi:hypothetical protein